jgi:death on curing protein
MATEGESRSSPVGEVMEDIRRELVRRVAAADRDENRGIYDALEDE